MMHDTQTPRLLTVRQFVQRHSAFTEGGIRHLIFHSAERVNSRGERIAGNGFAPAFKRVGRKLLVDECTFFACVEAHNNRPYSRALPPAEPTPPPASDARAKVSPGHKRGQRAAEGGKRRRRAAAV